MPLFSVCKDIPVTKEELEALWQHARTRTKFPDDAVTMQCVSKEEITRLNQTYRSKNSPTNILTFSYEEGEHDIALCMDIAQEEASIRGIAIRDYVALLITHALLHVCKMDHERSSEEAKATALLEQEILVACGFVPQALSDVY